MEEQLITFKTSAIAKVKGFHEETQAMTVGENYPIVNDPKYETPYDWNSLAGYSLPTQSLLQKWLRERHNIHINLKAFKFSKGNTFVYEVNCLNVDYHISSMEFTTYEKALEQALIDGLGVITNYDKIWD